MSLRIRLARRGAKKRPFYRIVVADARAPRDGRFLAKLGTYDPLRAAGAGPRMALDLEKVKVWLARGAQPSDRVARFLECEKVVPATARDNPHKGRLRKKAQERREKAAEEAKSAQTPAPQAAPAAPEEDAATVDEPKEKQESVDQTTNADQKTGEAGGG